MTRVLRSAAKKIQNSEDLTSMLSISNKSKAIKKRDNKVIKAKNEVCQQSSVWKINSVMSNIFAYINHQDLIEFNTVCKKWNNLTNPIIHKTIKLNRSWDVIMQVHDKRFNTSAKIDSDVVECISNNSKHAAYVKSFYYNYELKPQRAIEVFETFRFICNLTIRNCDMSQDQFLGMINPLTQLQELTLSSISIKSIVYKRLYKETVQLPHTLKKLTLLHIRLIDNPELFIRTINSHNNLEKFFIHSQSSQVFLEVFHKNYPSLLNFELNYYESQTPQSLIAILKNNPQLISLNLKLDYANRKLVSDISSYLINLEKLNLSERASYSHDYTDIDLKFSQPTKIKKLGLNYSTLSNSSIDSILLNCPHLEELSLNKFSGYQQSDYHKFINHSNSNKLNKLVIGYNVIRKSAFNSLFSNCQYLIELDINLPVEWKEVLKSIYENCANLEILNIFPPYGIYGEELDTFFQEFYESEFFTRNPKCKFTLTHLTLNNFKIYDSKAGYFKKFEKLKSIKYPKQFREDYNSFDQETEIDLGLWPDYALLSIETGEKYNYDIEIKKIINK